MDNAGLMSIFEQLTKFISLVCGNEYEIVLHNIEDPESSIIAIENGIVSGRSVGGPMSDLALKMLSGRYYENNDFVVNRGTTRDGKVLASSTFFVKNDKSELIGMLCINHDLTGMIGFRNALAENLSSFGIEDVSLHDSAPQESLAKNVEDLMSSIYTKTIGGVSIPPDRMSYDEKMEFVGALEKQGYFLLKGAVPEIARLLKVSEATVYRYLNKNGKHNS